MSQNATKMYKQLFENWQRLVNKISSNIHLKHISNSPKQFFQTWVSHKLYSGLSGPSASSRKSTWRTFAPWLMLWFRVVELLFRVRPYSWRYYRSGNGRWLDHIFSDNNLPSAAALWRCSIRSSWPFWGDATIQANYAIATTTTTVTTVMVLC